MKSVLVFAYYSIKDPVFQSAVLQYFKKYSPDFTTKFILLTFEHKGFVMSPSEVVEIEKELAHYNLIWHRLTWHSGSLKSLKKAYDLVISLWTIRTLINKYHIKTIYSEGFPGAIIGHLACTIFKLSHIIHSFEPHADYMLEAGEWSRFSWEYRILKYYERKIAFHATWILTATTEMKQRLVNWGVDTTRICQVPSCIDTDLFQYNMQHRVKIRKKYGFKTEDRVVVYLGKFGGMYWSDEFYEMVGIFTRYSGCSFKFLVVTSENHQKISSELHQRGVDQSRYSIIKSDYSQVHEYLSAADMGLVAVRQKPSKRFCSPIKTGEYLSCGLPVIIPKGISDDYEVLVKLGLAVLLEDTSMQNLRNAPIAVEKYLYATTHFEIVEVAREYAIKNRSLHKYRDVYRRIFTK